MHTDFINLITAVPSSGLHAPEVASIASHPIGGSFLDPPERRTTTPHHRGSSGQNSTRSNSHCHGQGVSALISQTPCAAVQASTEIASTGNGLIGRSTLHAYMSLRRLLAIAWRESNNLFMATSRVFSIVEPGDDAERKVPTWRTGDHEPEVASPRISRTAALTNLAISSSSVSRRAIRFIHNGTSNRSRWGQ